jgi:ribonuclease HII
MHWSYTNFPDACKGVDIVVGIDEAGRGPVLGTLFILLHINSFFYTSYILGSLIYCAAFWPASEHEAISKLGFDDSKALKEHEREM